MTDQATEVDGVKLAKNQETMLSPTARVLLAGVMTLQFAPEVLMVQAQDAATTGYGSS